MVRTGRTNRSGSDPQAAGTGADGIGDGAIAGLLDATRDGFAVFDDQDRLVFHNRRFIELFPFLEPLGDLQGLTFFALASVPDGEMSRVANRDGYVAERLRHHADADGEPFLIPLEDGGWVQVRENRTPELWTVATWSDVSRLKASEARLHEAIDGIAAGLVLLDAEERIVQTNSGLRQMLAGSNAALEPGRRLSDVLDEASANGFFAHQAGGAVGALRRAAAKSGERPVEIPLRDGGWILASHNPLPGGGSVGIWTDLTAQKKREAELVAVREQLRQHTEALADFARLIAQQARHDMLTGLLNRFALEERLDQLQRDGETGTFWVGVIDVDHFNGINDAVGHAAGDDLLRDIGRFLRAQLRADDTLARIGADEFAIVLTGLDEAEVTGIANRLNAALQTHPFRAGGHRLTLTASIGLTLAQPGQTPSGLLAAADTACRVAKEGGRDRVQLYDLGDPKVHTTHQRVGWAERIRLGLELNRFRLHLQAIVDTRQRVCGYEALIRLIDSEDASYSPAQFLPAARRLGLMGRIDNWVCRQCVDFAMQLLARGEDQYVSMNLGVHTLANTAFQRKLLDLIDANPGIERALRIEITETDEMYDAAQVASFLSTLRTHGLHVYLDDFGNGYNSFEALKQLPVDGIKIDWTVTRDLLNDPIDEAQIKAAVSITSSLGLELVVEGVEEEQQLARLKELGATLFQGFYFHRPVGAETIFA
ncbi:Uncharacterised protein [Starkeya nomas]|uniref:EAL domain-containing protein n=1 Tax=Starkeya nomas TaxID=2666134 RepID=A0A5S9NC06_9HYPH|nr:EAL domain-containing protein [Starkeya nomas]CAA0087575.1 Uncharacterised protein [Starkeya nomas]